MGKRQREIKEIFACSNGTNSRSPHSRLDDYANTVFGSDLDDSDYSFLLRKLDRYENGSSYTSNEWTAHAVGKETPTSKLIAPEPTESIDDELNPKCKKQLFDALNPGLQGVSFSAAKSDKGYDLVQELDAHEQPKMLSGVTLNPELIASIMRRLNRGSSSTDQNSASIVSSPP